jgi:hypothetical protein
MRTIVRTLVFAGVACVAAASWQIGTASAQTSATAPQHPALPWSLMRHVQGQVLSYIAVPPSEVVVDVPAVSETLAVASSGDSTEGTSDEKSGPASTPVSEMRQERVEIPGYFVTVTTFGYVIPERWTLLQVGPGAYQWARLPAEVRTRWP